MTNFKGKKFGFRIFRISKNTWWIHYRTNILQGFRRGELTIFSGRTGQGKTTFLSEYSLDLCMQNVTTLWGSFEVKNSRLAKMQLKQFSGVNLEENLDSFDKWADLFQKMPMFYMTFFGANEVSCSTYWIFTYLRKLILQTLWIGKLFLPIKDSKSLLNWIMIHIKEIYNRCKWVTSVMTKEI